MSVMLDHPSFPVALQLRGRSVVVVGDSQTARRRIARLERAEAQVSHILQPDWAPSHCEGAFMVLACTNDRPFDAAVVAAARSHGCLVYAHDQPTLSDFAMPAIAERTPVTIAISTHATAPALSRRFRELLQNLLDEAGSDLDALIETMVQRRKDPSQRASLYELARALNLSGSLDVDSSSE